MNNLPSIKTNRLLIRSINEMDIENIYRGLSDPEVIQYYGISYNSLEATQEQMDWYAAPDQYWWAINSADNKTFYGAAGLNDVLHQHHKAEIGFWLLPPFWGQGIIQEALPEICRYGYDKLNLHRIEGFVESDNENSKKALTKLNFKHEGTMRDCEIKNGQFISLEIYAKIK
ncbi:GNAT family N-acetyltransferase [Fulvivirga sediminis]|uniref:GNAT family N-acetyltransferase n=1 Tax=Fulvivirga sediminis TaxID=2803949 RepID=A0A937F5U6_9BACT|nr:GNAT family protein [Fulvivirga sediminis]MBL3655199.1 GNAT family N-acetyltransferase [Fulvivirga sediminis]